MAGGGGIQHPRGGQLGRRVEQAGDDQGQCQITSALRRAAGQQGIELDPACGAERGEHVAMRQSADDLQALHPEKTKLVCCKDTNRKRDYGVIQFDFLGCTFRPRLAKWKGGVFGVSYLPAAGPKALKAIRQTIRGSTLQTRSDKALDDLAPMFNSYIRGWINYYSHFYKSALYPMLRQIDVFLIRWARRKFKRLRQQPKGAREIIAGPVCPLAASVSPRPDTGSGMSREVHVRFWERAGVYFARATRCPMKG